MSSLWFGSAQRAIYFGSHRKRLGNNLSLTPSYRFRFPLLSFPIFWGLTAVCYLQSHLCRKPRFPKAHSWDHIPGLGCPTRGLIFSGGIDLSLVTGLVSILSVSRVGRGGWKRGPWKPFLPSFLSFSWLLISQVSIATGSRWCLPSLVLFRIFAVIHPLLYSSNSDSCRDPVSFTCSLPCSLHRNPFDRFFRGKGQYHLQGHPEGIGWNKFACPSQLWVPVLATRCSSSHGPDRKTLSSQGRENLLGASLLQRLCAPDHACQPCPWPHPEMELDRARPHPWNGRQWCSSHKPGPGHVHICVV